MKKVLEYKHSLAIRWLHWINFPLLAMMIWSGLLIYWANPVYSINFAGREFLHFFPTWFYDALGVPYRLAEGLQLHFFFMWLFAINGLAYAVYLAVSGEWRAILPVPSSFPRAAKVALHDVRIVKAQPPQGKYNDAQRIAYTAVLLMGALSALSGLAIYKPTQLAWLTALFGGYEWARWIHFWLTILFVAFFFVHVVQVAAAGWRRFVSMISGRELIAADEVTQDRGTADTLGEKRFVSEALTPDDARRRMAALTRRSFILGGAAAAFGILGWRWMSEASKTALLRRTFEFNERVAQVFYSPARLAPEFSRSQLTPARVNGDLGMTGAFDADAWRLAIGGIAGRADDLNLSLDEIKALPRTDMIIEFMCIEGWSTITHFAGVRFTDLVKRYAPQNTDPYVALTTPDGGYYVGWDIEAAMHPQTLLAYELNGHPLTAEHGAPLRLASPTKYGIKQIKRIGRIEFTGERPPDFWAERGYDWYAGL